MENEKPVKQNTKSEILLTSTQNGTNPRQGEKVGFAKSRIFESQWLCYDEKVDSFSSKEKKVLKIEVIWKAWESI